jgi:hypothetical protein
MTTEDMPLDLSRLTLSILPVIALASGAMPIRTASPPVVSIY